MPTMRPLHRRRRRRRESGQALPLVAAAVMVLTGFAGVTVDLGHQYVTKRQLQAAADAASLAGAATLGGATPTILGSAPNWNDPAVYAAHDYAAANGFLTTFPASAGGSSSNYFSPACYSGGGATAFSEMFFDSAHGTSCTSGFPTSGFDIAVQINVPPVTLPGYPTLPSQCDPNAGPPGYPDNCIQVVVTAKVSNYIMGVFGQPNEYLVAVATGYAAPASGQQDLPPNNAVYLYQPASGCTGQCYTTSSAPSKGQLDCTGSNNCPTLWSQNIGGGNAIIQGVDGSKLTPATHITAVQSAGHIVNQENMFIPCDPYAGLHCDGHPVASSTDYALGPSANIYCSKVQAGTPTTACNTTSPPASTQPVAGNEVSYSPRSWAAPDVTDPGPTHECGGLILNGDPMTPTNNPPVFFDATGTPMSSVPSTCIPSTNEPYTIKPGRYRYIVINHGKYDFDGGLYYIYGTAPVNNNSPNGSVGVNGIDHSQETNTVGHDWDLCNQSTPGNNPAGTKVCSGLTAGVWIGHGWQCGSNNRCGALVNSTGTTCANGTITGGTVGGGGDKTDITGSGVSFYFTSASAGFVSTKEVDSIVLSGPAPGALAAIGGAPILVNQQNNAWSHLDGNSGQNVQFTGVMYQPSSVTGGGVDIDPGAASHMQNKSTLVGQVRAYSLDLFGVGGTAVNFSAGWGSGSSAPSGAGNNETSLITIPPGALTAAGPGFETLTVNYTDEWMLDAYDMSIEINSLSIDYFSTPIWSISPNTPPVQGPYPPQNGYTPSDANPEYMAVDQGTPYYTPPAPFVAGTGIHEYSRQSHAGYADNTTWDVSGDWNWGNQSNVPNAQSQNFAAVIAYTFPTPPGTQVTVVMHTVDGDHCGDYDNTTATFTNVGNPGGGGIATRGSSLLVQ